MAGPEQVSAAASGPAAFDAVSPAVFWTVLGGAVVVLLGLIVRLMKNSAA